MVQANWFSSRQEADRMPIAGPMDLRAGKVDRVTRFSAGCESPGVRKCDIRRHARVHWFHQIMAADFSRFGQVRQGRHSEILYCFVDILFCRLEWLDRQSFCGKVDPTGADFLSSLPKLAKLAVSRFQKLGPKHSPMAWFWHSYIILPKLKLQPRGKIWL